MLTTIPEPDLDRARVALNDDDFLDAQPTASVHVNLEAVAVPLLVARGWRRDTFRRAGRPDSFGWTSPDGQRYWHTDEALTLALTAEGFALTASPDVVN